MATDPDQDRATDNAYEFTVGELSAQLKRAVEDQFGSVRLRGEISGWKTVASGHSYFTLKDEDAVIDAVLWRGQRGRLDFEPEDGLDVIASGKVTTYPGRSKYQIVVDRMKVAGAGALMALLEKRKAALTAEGLFAAERKRELPYLPRKIGIVTSPTGAVIRDMLHRLADRFPRDVMLWPVKVQGEGAKHEIAAAVAGFNAMPDGERPDLLIVARGGGSIEDLWAFNEEEVVRAVAASAIPTISAVGHETDTTLCDFAADVRAPTPTAAAERAVPVRAEIAAWTADLAARLDAAIRERGRQRAERLALIAARLPAPATFVESRQQRLDDLSARLPRPSQIFDVRAERLSAAAQRLVRSGSDRVRQSQRDLASIEGRLSADRLDQIVARHSERAVSAARLLASVNPEAPLARGFALVENEGLPVTSAAKAKSKPDLTLRFADGKVGVHVGTPPRRPRRKAVETPKQDRLF